MIQFGAFARKTRLLTSVAASFAVALLGTGAVAGDKQKAQKAIDQWAAQMQADGVVNPCSEMEDGKGDADKDGQIATEGELKRLLLSGLYTAKSCTILGSQPEKFPAAFQQRRLRYFALSTTPNARIVISKTYAHGDSWFKVGSTGSFDEYRKDYDPAKDKRVKSSYTGFANSYVILTPATGDPLNKESRNYCEEKRKADIAYNRIYIDTKCLRLFPQDWEKLKIQFNIGPMKVLKATQEYFIYL